LAFVTQGIVMKTSNLALRPGPVEDQPAPPPEWVEIVEPDAPAVLRVPSRPRRSLAFRALPRPDQELRLFRVG
jgi:hypothetical protein